MDSAAWSFLYVYPFYHPYSRLVNIMDSAAWSFLYVYPFYHPYSQLYIYHVCQLTSPDQSKYEVAYELSSCAISVILTFSFRHFLPEHVLMLT